MSLFWIYYGYKCFEVLCIKDATNLTLHIKNAPKYIATISYGVLNRLRNIDNLLIGKELKVKNFNFFALRIKNSKYMFEMIVWL